MDYHVSTPTGSRKISIAIPDQPFGVLISGGFDSTVLLHALAQQQPSSLMTFNVERGQGTEPYSQAIADDVADRYGVTICHTGLPIPVLHHSQQVLRPAELLLRGVVKTIMVGTTQNPTHLPNGPARPLPRQYRGYDMPFLHCDKSHVVALADQLGVLDLVSAASHSCTERPRQEDRCRECFQCREREWAFAANDRIDLQP